MSMFFLCPVLIFILLVKDAPHCVVDKIFTKDSWIRSEKVNGCWQPLLPLEEAQFDATVGPQLEEITLH